LHQVLAPISIHQLETDQAVQFYIQRIEIVPPNLGCCWFTADSSTNQLAEFSILDKERSAHPHLVIDFKSSLKGFHFDPYQSLCAPYDCSE